MIRLSSLARLFRNSLQLRLLFSTSLASCAILALLSLSIYFFMWGQLQWEFDESLKAKARSIESLVEDHDSKLVLDTDFSQMPEFTTAKHPEYFEIWTENRKVVARSPSLNGKDLPRSAIDPDPPGTPVLLPDGHRGRQVTLSFSIRPDHDDDDHLAAHSTKLQTLTIVLAARPFVVNQTLDDLEGLLWTLCSAAVVISGVLLILIVRRALRPVNQLAADIGSLNDLSRRLALHDVPMELSAVVEKLNGLLTRLEQSFSREKAFTADVAHELRTPLAGITTTLEVCRSRPRQSSEYESAIDECRAMTGRLQAMIETLLMLARADAGQLPLKRQAMDLSQLMQECWRLHETRAAERHLSVQSSTTGDCSLPIDVDKMRIVLGNLLDNAVSYANESGSIRWSLRRSDGAVEIEIANTGSQVNAEDAEKLFDRFYRGDSSRADTGVHCGLGLSLCRRLIRLMGGTIDIKSLVSGEFTAILQLPVQPL